MPKLQKTKKIKEKWGGISHLIPNSKRLIAIAFREHPYLFIALTLVTIGSSLVPFFQSGVIALIINKLVDTGSETSLTPLIIALVTISVFPDFLANVYNYLDKRIWIQMINSFELIFAKKQGELEVADLENPKFQDTIVRARENFYALINMTASQFDVLRNIIGLVVASVVLLTFSPLIFAVVLIGAIPAFWTETMYGSGEWTIWMAKSEERRRFSDLRLRFMRLPEVIEMKIFQNVQNFIKRMEILLGNFEKEQIRNEGKRLIGNFVSFTISVFSIGFAIYWAVQQVTLGAIEIGTMTFVLYSITNFNNSFSAFLLTIARQIKHSLYVKDIFEVLDRESHREGREYKEISNDKTPEIIFESVSFKYPDSKEYVLKDLTLTISPNSRLALVGVNGAGKTTLVKLLAGFYEPTKGRILVDGVDLKEIDLVSWYQKIAVLFQDYATYNFLTKEGIALGNSSKEEDFDDVQRAAKLSDADSFIKLWKKQYEQMIGKEFTDGVEPSKGQAQKLALARSFYRQPKVLILDEPTASVDAEAEAKIFESLEELEREQTMILISHRFSTVRNADLICIIENGTISEKGTHEELLQKEGTYARLFHKQAKGYK